VCGILGCVGEVDDDAFARALDRIAHRGPDDAGSSCTAVRGLRTVRLAQRRLAIIDTSSAGHQPMSIDDGRYSIVYNGEVYNYQRLRAQFGADVRWQSATDTEVVLRLFARHGVKSFGMLDGMFAFALLDSERQRLYLVRDQFGIKPLYYSADSERLIFCSEIKGILALSQRAQRVDPQALYHFFSFLYFPEDQTVYRDIRQLEPGCYAEIDLRSGSMELHRYYEPPRVGSYTFRDEGEAAQVVRAALSDSVRDQMVADVPLGAFLSAGTDSTAILGLMSEHSSTPINTFTVRFEGAGAGAADESAGARVVSERYGSAHHEIEVDISRPYEMFDLIDAFDQPFANPTFYLSYLVSRETRRHVTVALSGAGGDELFGGYPRYKAVPYSRALSALPAFVARGLRRSVALVPEGAGNQRRRRMNLLLDGVGMPAGAQYLTWTYFNNAAEKTRLLNPRLRQAAAVESEQVIDDLIGRRELRDAVLDVDMQTFLPSNILEYSDRTSMAVSLEVRVPFITTKLYDIARSMPPAWRTGRGRSKRVLYRAIEDLIPPANRLLPKTGFCPPLDTWMPTLDRYFDEHMTRAKTEAQGVFNWEYLQQLRAEQRAGRRDNSMRLFGAIMFDVWWRRAGEPSV
jgi:asparagine synthase (glutamine-hydrolysing)